MASLRFDRVVRSAGFLRSMKTYSLVLTDDGLYLIVTGPAGRIFNPLVLPDGLPPFSKEVAEVEAQITTTTLDPLSQRKYGAKILLSKIRSVALKRNVYQLPHLTLKSAQGTFRLEFRAHSLEEVEALVRALRPD